MVGIALKKYLVITGPTASGKSALAMQLALALHGELINCDSVQVYRGFDIGSAKASRADQELIPHHGLDLVSAAEDYDARVFAEETQGLISEIRQRQRMPIIVGGTGLYLRALWRENWHDLPKNEDLRKELDHLSNEQLQQKLEQIDPVRASQLHRNDRFRLLRAVEIVSLLGGPMSRLAVAPGLRHEAFTVRLLCPRPLLIKRIEQRVAAMLAGGLLAEVEALLAAGVDPAAKPMQSIGYLQAYRFLKGEITAAQLPEQIIIATRQYAKRQETWLNQLEFDATWSEADDFDSLLTAIRTQCE
ncbi:MAG: tRNA (adenosine(37)-N6)-dimethylallyltransferase MiaA [Proteobacteria bacterium]|nr:tRNA (adenosine(37)-N6)-dimethylallyltransferase MiaA [Pseudomonadota bacterium]